MYLFFIRIIGLCFNPKISAKFVDEIFDELVKVGEVIIKDYHNWNQSQSWSEKLQEFAIESIQSFPNNSDKILLI